MYTLKQIQRNLLSILELSIEVQSNKSYSTVEKKEKTTETEEIKFSNVELKEELSSVQKKEEIKELLNKGLSISKETKNKVKTKLDDLSDKQLSGIRKELLKVDKVESELKPEDIMVLNADRNREIYNHHLVEHELEIQEAELEINKLLWID